MEKTGPTTLIADHSPGCCSQFVRACVCVAAPHVGFLPLPDINAVQLYVVGAKRRSMGNTKTSFCNLTLPFPYHLLLQAFPFTLPSPKPLLGQAFPTLVSLVPSADSALPPNW